MNQSTPFLPYKRSAYIMKTQLQKYLDEADAIDSEWIRQKLTEGKHEQNWLAEKLNIGKGHMSMLLSGKRELTLSVKIKIYNIFL